MAACFAELAMIKMSSMQIEILIRFERYVAAKGFRILVKTLGAREYPKRRKVNSNLWPFQKKRNSFLSRGIARNSGHLSLPNTAGIFRKQDGGNDS